MSSMQFKHYGFSNARAMCMPTM